MAESHQATEEPIKSLRVRLVTLNCWGLAWPLALDVTARLHAIGEALPGLRCDVVAFQEVWTEEAVQILTASGERAGLKYAWNSLGPTDGGGLLVISRTPLLAARFERLVAPGNAGTAREAGCRNAAVWRSTSTATTSPGSGAISSTSRQAR